MPENDLFPLDPDFVLAERLDPGVLRQLAASGRDLQRLLKAPQRLFQLHFRRRSTDEVEKIRDWHARFQHNFFRFNHKTYSNNAGAYLARHFPVVFFAEPDYELVSNEAWNIEVSLLEAVGRALPTANYPDPTAGHPSFFIEEDNALAKALAGSWPIAAQANAHGGQEASNTNLNTTDAYQFLYAGYGFRLWARKDSNLGTVKVLLDETDLGNVSLFAASAQLTQVVLTKLDVPLGLHRVKLKATVIGGIIVADAIEAIP